MQSINKFQNIPIYKAGVLMPMDDLRKLLSEAFRQGRQSYAIETGKACSFYSYNAMIKKYTRPVVDGWISNNKIKPFKVGTSVRFDKREVEELAASDIYMAHLCRIEY
jgi:hypothetical protein